MPILTSSQDTNTRFFALRLLEKVIKTSWKDLNEQKQSIMNTVVGILCNALSTYYLKFLEMIRNITSNEQAIVSQKLILQKCNQLLVQVPLLCIHIPVLNATPDFSTRKAQLGHIYS